MNKFDWNRGSLLFAGKELILHRLFLHLLLLSLPFFAASCGQGNLSRKDATEQLRSRLGSCYDAKAFAYNLESDGLFHFVSNKTGKDRLSQNNFKNIINDKDVNTVSNFEKLGYVITQLIKSNNDLIGLYIHYYRVALTEKGKIFLSYEEEDSDIYYGGKLIKLIAKVQKFENIEILDIAEPVDMFGLKVSTVKYRASWKPTALGKELSIAPENKEGEAKFVLYDTGWELESL